MRARAGAAACLVAVVTGLSPSTLDAQDGTEYRARVVSPHDRGTLVAVAVRLPVGSAADPPGRGGTATLLARLLAGAAADRLDPASATLDVRVERGSTTFTLLGLPDGWRKAWATVEELLFDRPLPPESFPARRAELAGVLAFEAGSPERDFEAEAAALLVRPGDPWAGPPRGTAVSVGDLELAGVAAFRRAHYRRELALMAVVGPVPEPPPPIEPPAEPSRPGPAWSEGRRIVRVRAVTNAWIAVAYPVPASLPRTTLELVAHLVAEELDPVPPDPDRHRVEVRIEETPGGSVLVVEASVLPEAVERWEARIRSVVGTLASERLDEPSFRWKRRRFRAARLLDEARPEAEAGRLTGDLARTGRARDLGVEIWALDAEALLAAASALGGPRVLVVGPDLGS